MIPSLVLVATVQASAVVLPWSDGVLYAVTATPGRVTDIVLEPGENLTGPGPVAAGDTARWILGDTESGTGSARRVHILAKPTVAGISTNLVVTTDRRTYHLELRSTPSAYMASVAWRYPASELIAVRGAPAAAVTPAVAAPAEPALERLNFAWRIEGQARWKPIRVFDDGRRVAIDFPPGAAEMPPLFERGARGDAVQLINYRVVARRIVVDRLFEEGELRMGEGRRQQRVRLTRQAAPQGAP